MTANVSIDLIWWNRDLADYFFRDQSMHTLEQLVRRAKDDTCVVLDVIDEHVQDTDIYDVEKDFYQLSVEELADIYGIKLEDKEEESEE